MGRSLGTLSGDIAGTTTDNHQSLAVADDVYSVTVPKVPNYANYQVHTFILGVY